jgi:NADH:ubiquinone oxidoreductase subunit B-like Fe-S oxidoreductase
VDRVIPVDVYVPGCAAKPEAIIDGVVLGLEKFRQLTHKRSVHSAANSRMGEKINV